MTRARLLPLLAVPLSLLACSPHPAPQTRTAANLAQPSEPPLPQSPDIHDQVMGWAVVSSGDRLLQEIAPPADKGADPNALKRELAGQLGLNPDLARLLDLRRPAAIALLNPALLASQDVRPFVAMLPVTSRAEVEKFFAENSRAPIEKQPWGLALPAGRGKLYVGFHHGYALVAWRADLLQAAERLLQPKLAARPEAPIVIHASLDNVGQSFGPQLQALVGRLGRVAESGGPARDPQVAFAMRGVERMTHLVSSLKDVELLADLNSGGLTFTVRLDGKGQGAFHTFVAAQRPGPAFGLDLLPRDAVMIFATHQNPLGRAADVESMVAYLSDALPEHPADAVQIDRWRSALTSVNQATTGELAYAVWPAAGGGVGLGGAYRLLDPGMGPAELRSAYDALASRLGPLVARGLGLDAARFADRFVASHESTKLAGTDCDVISVSVRWPAGAAAEKRLFESLFGPKLSMGTAFVGDRALFAIGPDWQARLSTMIAAARGQKPASAGESPVFTEALGWHPGSRVSISAIDTAKMAHLAASLLEQSRDLDDAQRAAVERLLSQVGSGAIVATTNAKDGRFELSTHVPASAIRGAARLSGALWRVALSPLVNPPTLPPLPIPPPNVTPSSSPAGIGAPL